MSAHVERPWLCEACGYKMDRYADALGGSHTANLGDISMCIQCGHLYTRALHGWQGMTRVDLEALTEAERRHLRRVQRVRQEIVGDAPLIEQQGGHA